MPHAGDVGPERGGTDLFKWRGECALGGLRDGRRERREHALPVGLAAYVLAWRLRFSQQPFATLDRYCYGPLSLLLAAAFALLVFRRVVS